MMAHYVVGDVQGCDAALAALLDTLEARTPDARILFVGDLVNRGPDSLAVLRRVKALHAAGRAETVLGNHDLHLLARVCGARPAHHSDTLDALLAAPDCATLIEWLRHRPLLIQHTQHVLVHAGLFPAWSVDQAAACAREVEAVLRSAEWPAFLHEMYGNQPDCWSDTLCGSARLRAIINGMTRMRFCQADGRMDFATKEGIDAAPPGYAPWFSWPRASAGHTLVFGHWSTLGVQIGPDWISTDSGCVWGGALSAICLEDRQIITQPCQPCQTPGKTPPGQ